MYQQFMAVLSAVAVAGTLGACSTDSTGPANQANVASAKGSGSGGDSDSSDRVEIQLAAPSGAIFPGADGKAKYRDRGGEQQLEIEVEDIPPGTLIDFFVGGAPVGSATADGLGNAELRLNSDEGDAVPNPIGQTVEARSGGALVVSGSF